MIKNRTMNEELQIWNDEIFAAEEEQRKAALKLATEEDEAYAQYEELEYIFRQDILNKANNALCKYEVEQIRLLDKRTVCRFMSAAEFDSLMKGEVLENRSSHDGCRTGSVGFCFLADESTSEDVDGSYTVFTNGKITPKQAYTYLRGVVNEDRFVIFELANENMGKFLASYGTYADPWKDGWYDYTSVTEFSTETYDRSWLKPIKAYIRKHFEFVEIPLD